VTALCMWYVTKILMLRNSVQSARASDPNYTAPRGTSCFSWSAPVGKDYTPEGCQPNTERALRSLRSMLPLIICNWRMERRKNKNNFLFCLDGLGCLACAHSELINSESCEFCKQLVGLLGRVISPTYGHYLRRTTQTQNKRRHPCLECDSNSRAPCLSGWRHSQSYS
jgi:hypothetical protein